MRSAPRGRKPRKPKPDPVVFRGAIGYEDADFLQRQAAGARLVHATLGDPLFGVSGWIVSTTRESFPVCYAKTSLLRSSGFEVVSTPWLGRGHVVILLRDPVDEEQAWWKWFGPYIVDRVDVS